MTADKVNGTEAQENKEYVCPHCHNSISLVFAPDGEVSDGYFAACTECDEDFFEFELVRHDH